MDPIKSSNKNTFEMEKNILKAFSSFIASILTGILIAVNSKKIIQLGGGPVNSNAPLSVPANITANVDADALKNQSANPGWLHSFFELVDKINNILLASVNNIAINTVDSVVQHTLGDLGKNPKKTILDKLNNGTLIVTQMANDPAVQLALQNLSQQLTVISLQMLETVQPQVNMILEKALDTLNQTANKSAKGLMDSGMNFVTSLIGNIPVYGGIVSLVMAFLRGFNDAAYAGSPGVKFSTDSFITAFNTVLKMIQDFNNEAQTLTANVSAVSKAVSGLSSSATSIPSSIKGATSLATNLAVPALPNVSVPTLPNVPVPALPVPALPTLPVPALPNVPVPALPVSIPLEKGANKQIGGAKLRKRINHITRRLKKTINRFVNNKKFTRKSR